MERWCIVFVGNQFFSFGQNTNLNEVSEPYKGLCNNYLEVVVGSWEMGETCPKTK